MRFATRVRRSFSTGPNGVTMQTLPSYVPVLLLGLVAVGFALFTVALSQLLGKPRPNAAKSAAYECGMPAVGTARERFPIKFYLVCMIFILFDVDAAFLYPWALILKDLAASGAGLFAFLEMMLFVALLGGGFVYAWKVGALDW
jgi:NADH-quinone oxidoreductase subunit A